MAKKGKFSQPRESQEALREEVDTALESAPEVSVPDPQEVSPVSSAAPEKPRKKRHKPSRNLTLIFYTLYVLMILSVSAWIFFHAQWLTGQLVRYEESQPEVAVEEIFADYFGQPDWKMLYHLAGVEPTTFEARDAFVTYMNETLSGRPLQYEPTPSPIRGHLGYLLKDGDTILGLFTLENIAPEDAPFPVWDLATLEIYTKRTVSVTILAPKGYTVSVNGVPLGEVHQITRDRIQKPHQATWYTYRLTGLLTLPEITVTDKSGESFPVEYDAASGMFAAKIDGFAYTGRNVQRDVRISFLYGDTLLFTNFYSPESTSLLAPVVSPPEGQIFTGWYRADMDESGEMVYSLVYTPDENGNIQLPEGTVLEPMTLYALFEDINTTDGGTE